MPVMDGITALKIIARDTAARVVMISSMTYEGAKQTMEALSLGAVDFITKPSGEISLDIEKVRHEIIQKVVTAYECKTKLPVLGDGAIEKFRRLASDIEGRGSSFTGENHVSREPSGTKKELIAIASSTGGPAALQQVLAGLPGNLPVGLVICQHLAAGFSDALAQRLNSVSELDVKVCKESEKMRPGVVLIGPPGLHVTVKRIRGELYAVTDPEPANTLHHPSADVLFHSVAQTCGPKACAVILTGMGSDGAKGIKEIKDRGGATIAQDEATCVVFGMPKVAIEMGGTDIIAPLGRVSERIMESLC